MDVITTTALVVGGLFIALNYANYRTGQKVRARFLDESKPHLSTHRIDDWKEIRGVVYHVFPTSVKYVVKGIPQMYYDRIVETTFTVPRINITRDAAQGFIEKHDINLVDYEQMRNVTIESILSRECHLFGYVISEPCPITNKISLQG